jgi:tetratricopeptide (TPR) repeat protein
MIRSAHNSLQSQSFLSPSFISSAEEENLNSKGITRRKTENKLTGSYNSNSKKSDKKKNSMVPKYGLDSFPGTGRQNFSNHESVLSTSLFVPSAIRVKLEPASCFMWFLVQRKSLGDALPDYELTYCKKIFKDMLLKQPSCHEALFGLAKILFHSNKYSKALSCLEKAIKISEDPLYKKWLSILQIKVACNTKAEAVTCKTRVQSFGISLPKDLEILWCLLEISLSGLLNGKEIEQPSHYAGLIKALDTYFGYLSWSKVLMHEKQPQKTIKVLVQLIQSNPSRPEAYLLLWQHYYYVEKNYEIAEEIAREAFNKAKSPHYRTLLAVNYAKTFFRLKKFRHCFEILQKQYIENPMHIVFLYQYGRLCTKSEDLSFNGSAIGALQECLGVSRSNRYGLIYYWLSKAQILKRQYIESYYSMKLALKYLGSSETEKKSEIKKKLRELNPLLTKLEVVEKTLSTETSRDELDNCLILSNQIKDFQKTAGEMLVCKVLWKMDLKDDAIFKLKQMCSTSAGNLNFYFSLFEYITDEKEQKVIGKEMIQKCSNQQIPTQLKVEAFIIYSRILCRNSKPQKAINILKTIGKIFPPFPLANLPYVNELRVAKGFSDMLAYAIKKIKSTGYELSSNSDEFQNNSTNGSNLDAFDIESNMIFQSPGVQRKGSNFGNVIKKSGNMNKYRNLSIETETDNNHIGDLNKIINHMKKNETINGKGAFSEFSVSSDISFLYLIAKISMKFNVYLQDGYSAIEDYLNIIRFQNSIPQKEIKIVKALNAKAWLSLKLNKFEEGLEIMVEILPKLRKHLLSNKEKRIQEFIASTRVNKNLE